MIQAQGVAVAIRLLAIWFLAQAVALLTTITAYDLLNQGAGGGWPVAVNIITLLVLGALTWAFAPALASKVLAGLDSEAHPRVANPDLQRVALRTFGAVLAAVGACGLVFSVVLFFQARPAAGGEDVLARQADLHLRVAEFSRSMAQALIGVGLVLGRSGVRAVWDKVRGTHDYDAVDEPEGLDVEEGGSR